MLSLACIVVNDGSVVVAEMEDAKTVYALQEAVKAKKMYDFPADQLTLFLAKTDNGSWMRFSDADVQKLKHNPPPALVQSFLSKPQMEPYMALTAFDFACDDATQAGVVHVLVFVSAERWADLRPVKKAKMSTTPLVPAVTFALDPGAVLVPTAVAEGTLQSTAALSNDFRSFGGFPATMFVRQEMKMVWKILHDNYFGASPRDVHYVLVGSPGVGKSALLLLFCCYLATHHGYWIFCARSLKSEEGAVAQNVLLWFRGATVTGYPDCASKHLLPLKAQFNAEKMDNKFLIVGDGYRQDQLKGSLGIFVSCHLLSTSVHFKRTSQENRRLLALPAWSRCQVDALATALKMEDGDERFWYSGGSVREFRRDMDDLKDRIKTALTTLANESDLRVVDGYAADPLNDSIRRLFIPRLDDAALYTRSSEWLYVVDIPCALKYLADKWKLETVSKLCKFAETMQNASLHGQVFEVLVHRLAHDKALNLDMLDFQDNVDKALPVNMAADFTVSMGNGADDYFALTEAQKWAACLSFLREKATQNMYWCPGNLLSPAISSILISGGVVHYLQATVSSKHNLDWAKLREIHDAVRANNDLKNNQFKYVVATPRKTSWESYKKQTSEIDGISMGLAHVNGEYDK